MREDVNNSTLLFYSSKINDIPYHLLNDDDDDYDSSDFFLFFLHRDIYQKNWTRNNRCGYCLISGGDLEIYFR